MTSSAPDWAERLKASFGCCKARPFSPVDSPPKLLIRTKAATITEDAEEPKPPLSPIHSSDSVRSIGMLESPYVYSSPVSTPLSSPSLYNPASTHPDWIEGPLVGRSTLPASVLSVPFCPSDYVQFKNGPHPFDERARSLMMASQSNPHTFWNTFRSSFARHNLHLWSISTEPLTPFPDALYPQESSKEVLIEGFGLRSSRHWHQNTPLLHPATTTSGKVVMLRLVRGPGRDVHELNTLRTLQKLQQQERHRCWARILDFFEMGPWTFAATDFNPHQVDQGLDFRTLGDCFAFIRHITYAVWLLHENLICHRNITVGNVTVEQSEDATSAAPGHRVKYLLEGYQHAVKWPDGTDKSDCRWRGKFVVESSMDPLQWPPEARGLGDKAYSPFAADIYQLGHMVASLFAPLKRRLPELEDYLKASLNPDRHSRSSAGVLMFHAAMMQHNNEQFLDEPVPHSMKREWAPPWHLGQTSLLSPTASGASSPTNGSQTPLIIPSSSPPSRMPSKHRGRQTHRRATGQERSGEIMEMPRRRTSSF